MRPLTSITTLGSLGICGLTMAQVVKYLSGATVIAVCITIAYLGHTGVGMFENHTERTIRYRLEELRLKQESRLKQMEYEANKAEKTKEYEFKIKQLEAEKRITLRNSMEDYIEKLNNKRIQLDNVFSEESQRFQKQLADAKAAYTDSLNKLEEKRNRDRQLWDTEIRTQIDRLRQLQESYRSFTPVRKMANPWG